MRRHRRSFLFSYGIAILIVAVSSSLVLLLRVAVPFSPAFIIVAALVASGWYGGVGPGLLSAALWYFLSNYLSRTPPHSTFGVHLDDGDIFRIVLVMLIAALAGGLRRASLNRKARAYQ